MELIIDIAADVVEWQDLLNGTQLVSTEGVSADGVWSASGTLSWNIGLRESAGEGDLTLARSDGTAIFATLTRADVREADETGADEDEDRAVHLEYEIDGGEGAFAQASGTATADGALSRTELRARYILSLTP